jgi:hypothetical protein
MCLITSKTRPCSTCIVIQPQAKASSSNAVLCWAHTRTGKRCRTLVRSREGEPIPIPYCQRHLMAGDGALKVVQHPFAGQCLVARFDLPRRYRLAFHGIRGQCATSDREDRSLSFYPPDPVTGSNYYTEGAAKIRKINNYNGVVNPKGTGDILQFGNRNGRTGGMEFVTTEPILKNTQLCFWYGPDWWKPRNMKRHDVGTPQYPAPRRNKRLIK